MIFMGVELVDWLYPQDIFSFVKDHVIPYAPCMEYLPTFALKISQM